MTLRCTPGSVTGVGEAIAGGPASGMPGITATSPGVPVGAGDLLLNTSGVVLGIYDSGSTPSVGVPTFLPTAARAGRGRRPPIQGPGQPGLARHHRERFGGPGGRRRGSR